MVEDVEALEARLGRIGLVATDLDGTLLEHGASVSDRAEIALVAWRAQGGMTAVVTGRPLEDLVILFERMGAGVRWPVPDALICEERDIYLRGANGWHPIGNVGLALAAELSMHPFADEVATQLIAEAASAGLEVRRSSPATEAKRGYVELVYPDPASAEGARSAGAQLLAEAQHFLMAVRNVRSIAIRHPYSRKGFPLRALADCLALGPGGVAAVGDSLNDMTMLDGSFGFLGAAVANADPEVKRAVADGRGLLLQGRVSLGLAELVERILAAKLASAKLASAKLPAAGDVSA